MVVVPIAFLLVSGGWTATRVLRRVVAVTPIEDVRPLLERIPDEPTETVIVTGCMARQIRTLPEGLGSRQVVYLPFANWRAELPEGREIWIVHSRLVPGLCESMRVKLAGLTDGFDRPEQPRGGAVVYHTRVLTRKERREKRKLQLRAVGEQAKKEARAERKKQRERRLRGE